MNVSETLQVALAGRYEIEQEIGAGGMATVYLARDLKHDRQVALNVLRPELGAVLGVERLRISYPRTGPTSATSPTAASAPCRSPVARARP